ncbi:2-hydroxycarboxylate transporter family protein [Halalkalibacter kiskunsagensis]|uniref:2-hydroxycarboxylate transporter family protein n=1 Tax=Halalkalibacter kiskunsagensis TaxID=1548599 RepID=A0ABV6K863_9BACI
MSQPIRKVEHELTPKKIQKQTQPSIPNQKQPLSLVGTPFPWFLIFAAISLTSMYTGSLPGGMIGSLIIMIVLGELLGWIGNHTPIVKSYFGGGAIIAIFGAAYMVYAGLLPETTITMITNFMQGGEFLNFYIAALITGSILGMNSKTLIQAGSRFILPLLASVTGAMLLAGIAGFLVGWDFLEAVLIIAVPIMGGGMGAGAVPMSQIYSELMGNDPGYYISLLVPALALGNVFAIIFASLLNVLGNKKPSLTGNGQIMKGFSLEKDKELKLSLEKMGAGLLAALTFFVAGQILGMFIPLHPYALMIVLVAVVKILNLLPKVVEEGANQWYQFVAKTWTFALLIGIGIAYTDLNAVIQALSLQYIVIVFSVVLGAVIGSAVVGRMVGLYPIESAITAGLCMANMGGTGDVAVLSAARRMELMPFAQISSRLGGALILLLAGILIPMLL